MGAIILTVRKGNVMVSSFVVVLLVVHVVVLVSSFVVLVDRCLVVVLDEVLVMVVVEYILGTFLNMGTTAIGGLHLWSSVPCRIWFVTGVANQAIFVAIVLKLVDKLLHVVWAVHVQDMVEERVDMVDQQGSNVGSNGPMYCRVQVLM